MAECLPDGCQSDFNGIVKQRKTSYQGEERWVKQRFAAGQTHMSYPVRRGQPSHEFKCKRLIDSVLRGTCARWYAIPTRKIAVVGQRQSEVINFATTSIDHMDLLCSVPSIGNKIAVSPTTPVTSAATQSGQYKTKAAAITIQRILPMI